MQQMEYDVAVIGAGVGGICTAALLASSGYRTLVVEKLPFVGGRCSSINHRGFHISTGAVWLPSEGVLPDIYREAGAEYDVRCPDPQVFYRIGGKDFEPPDKGRLGALMTAATGDKAEGQKIVNGVKRGLGWEEPSRDITWRQWLMQYTQNEAAHGVFQAMISAFHTINADEIPAGEFVAFLKESSGLRRFGYAPRGNHTLMESLANAIRSKGSEIWLRSRARRILVEEGTAKGIIVEKEGKELEIRARVVVSDAGPRKTAELAGKEHFDKGYLRDLQSKIRPVPIIFAVLGSSRPLIQQPGALLVCGARRLNILLCPTISCPELAPKGKHLLYAGLTPLSCLTPLNFQQELEVGLADLRENLPDMDKYTEFIEPASWQKEWPVTHTWPGYDMALTTPVENLYNVGDAVKPSGTTGVSASAEGARRVAEDIKKRGKPGKA